jgi:benzoylformate decarboxylase
MDSSVSLVSVREAAFALFRSFGITTIFGNPGSTELPMFRDFPADFRYVLGLQESVVVGMADGFAQATRNAALVNLHSAAGVGHALGNIFTAYRNRTPLVITAGQQARSILPYEPFLYAQDATDFPKPYVKWSCQPARAEDVPVALARAYYTAMQAPCGPTFVSIPVDDWDKPCQAVEVRPVSRNAGPDPEMLDDAAQAMNRATRPCIVVGAGAARDDAWQETITLADLHQAAVWVAPMAARNAFPEDHRLFVGFLPANREKIVSLLAPYDFILVLGAPVFTHHTEGFGPFVPEGAAVVQVTDDPAAAAWAPAGTSMVGDVKRAAAELVARAEPRPRAVANEFRRIARVPSDRLTDRVLLQQIADLRPRGSIIVEEAPSSREPMHDHLHITERNGFYTCASGGLGHGLPAAIGVALGRPGERVIAILGDGSAMYAIQGLWSAAALKLPITFVILKNGGYRALDEFAAHFGLPAAVGTKLPGLDFCALAQGQGLDALRVSSVTDIDEALQRAFRSSGPNLVEVELVESV